MRILTWRGLVVAAGVGVLAAVVAFFLLVQGRHWLTDEQQLHEIVALIQQGRIQVAPPPQVPAAAPKTPEAPPPSK